MRRAIRHILLLTGLLLMMVPLLAGAEGELSLAVSLSADSVEAGGSMTATAEGHGGTPPYKYQFEWALVDGDSHETGLTQYTEKKSDTRTFPYGQTCTLRARVRDTMGREAEAAEQVFSITGSIATEPLRISGSLSADTVAVGGSLTATALPATGGTPPYRYSFAWTLVEGEYQHRYELDGGYQSELSHTFNFTYGQSGFVSISVTDALGRWDAYGDPELSFTITGSKPVDTYRLSANLSADAVAMGGSLTATAAAQGGTPPYEYRFSWSVKDNDGWRKIGETDYLPDTSHTQVINAGQEGHTYVYVRDALGRVELERAGTFTITPRSEEPATPLGDANGDGKVDQVDLGRVVDHLLQQTIISDEAGADATGDGRLSLEDIIAIIMQIVQ